MKSKSGLRIMNVLVALLLMLSNVMNVTTLVSAQSGSLAVKEVQADSGPKLWDQSSDPQASEGAGVREFPTVSLDGDVSSNTADDVSSIDITHTTGSGENRLMLVGVSWNCGSVDRAITSVTFTPTGESAISFELIRTEQTGTQLRYTAIYKSSTEPPQTTSGTVTVTFDGSVSNGIVAGVANFAGVNLSDPIDGSNGANANNTAPSVTLDSLEGDELVFDTVFQGASGETQTLTVGANQTEQWNGWIANTRAAASTEQAISTSVDMTWTAASASYWAIVAVAINPVFNETCYALTLTSSSNGSPATPVPENTPGCPAGEYIEGEVIDLTANPDWGYEVQAWNGTDNDSSTALTNVVTMPGEPRTVDVTYQSKACYELTLSSGDHGGDPTADPTFSLACTLGEGWYVEGETITLTAYPDSGYRVASWSGTDDDSLKAVTNVLTMPVGARTVNVTYEEVPPEVTLDGAVATNIADGVNTISVSHTTGSGENRLTLITVYYMNFGTATTIDSVTFTPDGGLATDLGSAIAFAEGGAARSMAVYAYADPPASTTGTITANFNTSINYGIVVGAINFQGVNLSDPYDTPATTSASATTSTPITLDVTTSGGDELVFDSVGIYSGAGSPTLTVNPSQDEHWNLTSDRVKAAGASTKQATGTTTTMGWTQSDAVYFAMAAIPINPAIVGPTQDLTMEVNITEGGTTTPAAGGTYTYVQNAVVPIIATPSTGYTFSHWTPDDTPGDPIANPYAAETTVTMDADYTVTAHFAPITYNLSISIVGNGSVETYPENLGPYDYGTVVDLVADADPGWLFTGWSGDVIGLANPESITMDGEKSVMATFFEMQPGTVYLDGPPAYGVMESGSTISIDTSTGSGENRLMLVGVSYNCSTTSPLPVIDSVTFTPEDESPLSLVLVRQEEAMASGDGRIAAIYYLPPALNPPAGTEGILSVNFSRSFTTGAVAGVANFLGVDQDNPLGTPNGDALSGVSSINVEVTTSGSELVFDTVWTGGSGVWTMAPVHPSQTIPQTELWNDGYGNTLGGASIRGADSGTTTMYWTRSNDGYMALVAVPINPVVEEELGTIIIEKQTDPDGATDTFTFTGDASGTISDDGQIIVNDLQAGEYHVQEVVPAGWKLTSIVCDDDNSTEDLPNFEADILLEAGETVKCTFYNLLELDFGDAPDSYGTLLASNGARHVIISGHSLGPIVDAEPDGQPTVNADGDDNAAIDDEDGVLLPATLLIGDSGAQITVDGGPSGGMLDAWIDFNGNGVFDHPSEHLWGGTSQAVLSGPVNTLIFAVPGSALPGQTYARFRLSMAGGLTPVGLAPDGEVEDYQVEIITELEVTDLDMWQSQNQTDWDEVSGSFAAGFEMVLDPSIVFYYLDTESITVNGELADGYHEFFVDTVPDDFFDYWAGRGVFDGCTGDWEPTMWDIISGEEPIFYLLVSGTDYTLVDGLQKLLGQGDQYLRIEGTYHLGEYTFTGTVTDTLGYTDEVSVDITFLEPLEVTDLDLWQSQNQTDWDEVSGSFAAGFEMVLDPSVLFYYLDTESITVNRELADGYHEFFVDTVPDGFFDYWAGRGVFDGCTGDWEPTMWQIIGGDLPIFYLKVSGTDYMLVDGLQKLLGQGDQYLRIEGDYWPGVYTFSGSVMDEEGFTDDVEVTITFNDLPTMDAIADKTIDEGILLTFTATTSDNYQADPLTYSLTGTVPTGVSITPGGVFNWTPSEDQGPDTYLVAIKVCEGDSSELCDEQTASITVNEVNLPPVGVEDNYSTDMNTTLIVNEVSGVLANDIDDDIPVNSLLAIRLTNPPHGEVFLDSDGSFVYIPDTGWFGIDMFTYKVNDGSDDSSAVVVTIEVSEPYHIFMPLFFAQGSD